MEERDTTSLEFQGDAPEEAMVRKAFRVPVLGRDGFIVKHGTDAHDIVDISISGASVSIKTPTEWQINALVAHGAMQLEDIEIGDLEGRVVHCTPSPKDYWVTGIQWLNLPAEVKNPVEKLLYALREELFENEQ